MHDIKHAGINRCESEWLLSAVVHVDLLSADELAIDAVVDLHQFVVRALLDQTALVDHEYPIAALDRAQPMGGDENRTWLLRVLVVEQRVLDLVDGQQ